MFAVVAACHRVLLLPGAVLPAEPAYAALLGCSVTALTLSQRISRCMRGMNRPRTTASTPR